MRSLLRSGLSLLLLTIVLFHSRSAISQVGRIPDKDEWIEVSEEPRPLVDIQTLIVYPEQAIRENIQGKVTVAALINEDGSVSQVDIEKSDHALLEAAAKSAMLKLRFRPAKQGTTPVKVWYTQTIHFKLNDSDPDDPSLELFRYEELLRHKLEWERERQEQENREEEGDAIKKTLKES